MCYIRINSMSKISQKTNLSELSQKYSKAGKVLTEKYGLHCVGCMAASFETLEDGLKVHGYDKKKINKIVEELNKLA